MTDSGYTVERLAFSYPSRTRGHPTPATLSHDRLARGLKATKRDKAANITAQADMHTHCWTRTRKEG